MSDRSRGIKDGMVYPVIETTTSKRYIVPIEDIESPEAAIQTVNNLIKAGEPFWVERCHSHNNAGMYVSFLNGGLGVESVTCHPFD